MVTATRIDAEGTGDKPAMFVEVFLEAHRRPAGTNPTRNQSSHAPISCIGCVNSASPISIARPKEIDARRTMTNNSAN